MGAAAAAMGVAPAYTALLVEAQVDAAVRYGLKPALASQLVVETMVRNRRAAGGSRLRHAGGAA